MTIPFSVLDLASIPEGSDAGQAFRNSVALAQRVEQLGYRRFWLAEHHNMVGVASAATSVVIGHVAAHTSAIRVGAGGVMLPNHAPLVIAEQFGTLESLFPGRIDLGLGRAPGADMLTTRALRRSPAAADTFPQDVQELQAYFRPAALSQVLRAVPGEGLNIPIWLLGSSLFSAQLAAKLGLPFAFAAHFAPDHLLEALDLYRRGFQPSAALAEPYAMVCINVIAADTDQEARRLATSLQQQFVALRRGVPRKLQPPLDNSDGIWSPMEQALLDHIQRFSIVGGPDTVRQGLSSFIVQTGADELMISGHVFDQAARRHSYEVIAEVRDSLAQDQPAVSAA